MRSQMNLLKAYQPAVEAFKQYGPILLELPGVLEVSIRIDPAEPKLYLCVLDSDGINKLPSEFAGVEVQQINLAKLQADMRTRMRQPSTHQTEVLIGMYDALFCDVCGHVTIRKGKGFHCLICHNDMANASDQS